MLHNLVRPSASNDPVAGRFFVDQPNRTEHPKTLKRAFTLIELLVVIAIIAILAAILFPVFAQAKLAAKKTAGLNQVKQIGTAMHLYLADYDDMFFAYRFNGTAGLSCTPANCTNIDYLKTVQSQGQAFADNVFGVRARDVNFHKQILEPYHKNNDLFKAPTKSSAWAGYDNFGSDTEPQFRSYGGQNSYGLNNYLFQPITGSVVSATSVEDVSSTIVMIDASYYNVLPKFPCQLKGSNWNPNTSSYPKYWKNLGNSYLFRWAGGAANEPSDAEAEKLIEQRYAGMLNIVRADSSAKALNWKKVVFEGPTQTKIDSIWDPFKQGCL
jgi:prepilin-type N-terminal cleavage/methylation domain-containing protein